MTNLEKLTQAGVVNAEALTKDLIDVINNHLSDDEVNALISTHKKALKMRGNDPVPVIFAI